MGLGFSRAGVVSAFQSAIYGGFTPPGGVFATLTSMGMTGTLLPALLLPAGAAAAIMTYVVQNRLRSAINRELYLLARDNGSHSVSILCGVAIVMIETSLYPELPKEEFSAKILQ
ncbi:hypothetical protein O181_034282 [Austropuccinia psidii MF-1]|uniref:Uncharacterized protein n=1 Tax=Austropuccinia psidii MF-1 TaxID=1389203 RepID=A0A9Q3D699_9BASI|nr:hypothetical protein [Austropuccinia psidii MF-1]